MSLTDAAVVQAATALYSDLTSAGCPPGAGNTSDFQTAYNNAGGSPALTVDDEYGPLTAAALNATIQANPGDVLGSYTAPAACSYGGGGGGTTTLPTTTVTGSVSTFPWKPVLIIGGLVAVAGGAVYVAKHHKKRRR